MNGFKIAVGCFVSALCFWTLGGGAVCAAQPPVAVEELTEEDFDTLVYGTRVVVQEGTNYYASAYKFGSGPHGTIGNRYTPLGTDLYVGGFSRLDKDGTLKQHRGYNPEDVPVAHSWQTGAADMMWDEVWLELFLDPAHESPIGWVPARSVVVLNGILGDGGSNKRFEVGICIVPKADDSEASASVPADDLSPEVIDNALPDPGNMIEDRIIHDQDVQKDNDDRDDSGEPFISTREIAYAIEDYADNGDRVALLLDASGSVSDHMSDIADYGEYVDKVNKAEVILAFGRNYKKIRSEEYLDVDVDGGATDIYGPINSLSDASTYDRIIIVTDTRHNVDYVTLATQTGFKGKIVIVCTNGVDQARESTIADIEDAFGTAVYLCRLDNELDRLRAMGTLTH